MKAHEEFFLFLEEHPELHPISKSGLYISIIKSISENAKSINELYSEFSSIESEDLDLIVKSLEKVRVLKKIKSQFSAIDE